MDKNAIGRKRHKPTDDEKDFYIKTASKIGDVRYKAGITQKRMAEVCGYSAQQIRSFENEQGEDSVVAIPAYVLAKYAEACDITVDEIINNWKVGRKMTAYARRKQEKAKEEEVRDAARIKRLKPEELVLVSKLRTEIGDVGAVSAAELLCTVCKEDLDLLYCIIIIEEMENRKYSGVIKALRSQIYSLYEAIGAGSSFNLTPDLGGIRNQRILDEGREFILEDGSSAGKQWYSMEDLEDL